MTRVAEGKIDGIRPFLLLIFWWLPINSLCGIIIIGMGVRAPSLDIVTQGPLLHVHL